MLNQTKFALASIGLVAFSIGIQTTDANAATVTITTNNVVSNASDYSVSSSVSDSFSGTTIPTTNHSLSATQGFNTSETTINYSASGGQTVLSHDFNHVRSGDLYDYTQSFESYMAFTVDMDTSYELSGYYDVTDTAFNENKLPGRVYSSVYLYDLTTGSLVIQHIQDSFNTIDESFTFGDAGGDSFNTLTGSLTGQLVAGHSYEWFSQNYIQATPDADYGATAVGNITLKVGVNSGDAVAAVPLPAALPLLLSALGFFGFMGWRRKKAVAA